MATYTGPCTDFTNVTHITNLHSSTRKFNITGLQEYSNYSIAITAFNDAGSSSFKIANITSKPSGGQNI